MKTSKLHGLALVALLSATPFLAQAGHHEENKRTTILGAVTASEDLTTLAAAVKAAGLTEALDGSGPLTVFAPTNAAFEALPDGTLQSLLNDPARLKAVLSYHVINGALPAAQVSAQRSAQSVNGDFLTFSADRSGTLVNDSEVTAADLRFSNGVVHLVDRVILPRENALQTAAAAGGFTTLLAAIDAAGLTKTLSGVGPFTIFAPSDDAFAKLPAQTVEALLADKAKLTEVLTYHVAQGFLTAADVAELSTLKTVSGSEIGINATDGVRINDAAVINANVFSSNAVIHVIDEVLLPPVQSKGATSAILSPECAEWERAVTTAAHSVALTADCPAVCQRDRGSRTVNSLMRLCPVMTPQVH